MWKRKTKCKRGCCNVTEASMANHQKQDKSTRTIDIASPDWFHLKLAFGAVTNWAFSQPSALPRCRIARPCMKRASRDWEIQAVSKLVKFTVEVTNRECGF